MSRRLRRAVLVVHIAAVGGWIGMDLVLAVLSLRAWLAGSAQDRAVSMQALELFGIVPMISLAVLSLVSGVVLSLGTKYGLFRYWWVVVKLVINVVFRAAGAGPSSGPERGGGRRPAAGGRGNGRHPGQHDGLSGAGLPVRADLRRRPVGVQAVGTDGYPAGKYP